MNYAKNLDLIDQLRDLLEILDMLTSFLTFVYVGVELIAPKRPYRVNKIFRSHS